MALTALGFLIEYGTRRRTPSWAVAVAKSLTPREFLAYNKEAIPPEYEKFVQDRTQLDSLLRTEKPWTAAEVDILLGRLRAQVIGGAPGPAVTRLEWASTSHCGEAVSFIGFRLGWGAPVEPGQVEPLLRAMDAATRSKSYSVRMQAIRAMFESGAYFIPEYQQSVRNAIQKVLEEEGADAAAMHARDMAAMDKLTPQQQRRLIDRLLGPRDSKGLPTTK